MAEQPATIKDLIVAAAKGAAAGVEALESENVPVELAEFEIEVNYSCSTEFDASASAEMQMKFWIVKAKFSAKTSYKRATTYGLKVRFLFTGRSEERASA